MKKYDDQAATQRLRLDPMLNMAAARPLTESLRTVRGANLLVDASDVQHLGAQCLQVLSSAVLAWRADSKRFAIENPSGAFRDGARLLGLDSLLKPHETY